MNIKKAKRAALVTIGLAVCFIFANSIQNGQESNERSGIIAEFLKAILDPKGAVDADTFHFYIRKIAHFTEFAILGVLLSLVMMDVWRNSRVRCAGTMLFTALMVAVVDEFIQKFTGRTSSVTDVLIDFCGAVVGLGLPMIWNGVCDKVGKKNVAKKCRDK